MVVTWQSFGQDGHMYGLYGRRFSSLGAPLGDEFRINQNTVFSQRAPAIAALDGGGFAVVWVSEEQRTAESVDIYGRIFTGQNEPASPEFRVNTSTNFCAEPTIAGVSGRGFSVGWTEWSNPYLPNTTDIYARSFTAAGVPVNDPIQVNTYRKGDQWGPKIASLQDKQLIVWSSLGQDGSKGGIYGQLLNFYGQRDGDEFRVNTTTIATQGEPTVASDGSNHFVIAWTSFTGGVASFDLFAQRYQLNSSVTLPAPERPFASALSQNSISVSWPEMLGETVAGYEIYVDSNPNPVNAQGAMHVVSMDQWLPNSAHTFRILYKLSDGRKSPLSPSATAVTWGADLNGDGLPDDWQTANWGKQANWPRPDQDSDGDGLTNYEEFLAGTDPTNPSSVLRTELRATGQGMYLIWNTEPGFVYQVQITDDLKTWTNFGSPRFAASTSDSMTVTVANDIRYYRVIRMR